jgi:hypothetical protein
MHTVEVMVRDLQNCNSVCACWIEMDHSSFLWKTLERLSLVSAPTLCSVF